MAEFSEQQKALVSRAVNTEINLLDRLYGTWTPDGRTVSHDNPIFAGQVADLKAVQEILYPTTDSPVDTSEAKYELLTEYLVDFVNHLLEAGAMAPKAVFMGGPRQVLSDGVAELVDAYVEGVRVIDQEAKSLDVLSRAIDSYEE